MSLRGGRSRFTFSSLPAAEFPLIEEINAQQTLHAWRKATAVA